VNPIAGLDAVEKIQIWPCREWNPSRLFRSPSLYRLSCPGSSVALSGSMNMIDELGRKWKEAVVICLMVLFHVLLVRMTEISGRMAGPHWEPLVGLLTVQPPQRYNG
jgi:hypothetical protein